MNHQQLTQKIENSIAKLHQNDAVLLSIDVNERTISHKLAEYIQSEFLDYSVDCEYNRHIDSTKILDIPRNSINWMDIDAKTIFPDIVIHEMLSDENNLLVVEIKKSSNRTNRAFDKSKIKAFTLPPFDYTFGLFLEIDVNDTNDIFEWYCNGALI